MTSIKGMSVDHCCVTKAARIENREQPEQSFDMELLDDLMLEASRSRQHDRRAAAVMLREGVVDVEARIGAAVHLMVGHKYTATCKERVLCASCGRKFAARNEM